LGCLFCPDCKLTKEGNEYTGKRTTTVNGKLCQQWSSNTPHVQAHYVTNANFPDGSIAAAENYCRNPDPSWTGGVWCHTTDPSVRWESCDVPMCDAGKLWHRL